MQKSYKTAKKLRKILPILRKKTTAINYLQMVDLVTKISIQSLCINSKMVDNCI